eukprot:757218-Hanusia_phi.AAC.7
MASPSLPTRSSLSSRPTMTFSTTGRRRESSGRGCGACRTPTGGRKGWRRGRWCTRRGPELRTSSRRRPSRTPSGRGWVRSR